MPILPDMNIETGPLYDDDQMQFRFMTDIIPQQLWTATPDGKLNYVNRQTTAYFGRTFEEIIGTGWQEFIHPDDLPLCLETWTTSLQQGIAYQIQFRLLSADGVYKWHLGRATPFMKDGNIVQWFGTNTDIDDQKKNEERKDDFLNIASHELRTPLTSAKAYLQLALKQIEECHKYRPLVSKGLQQIERLQNMINNLLDVSKINAGKLTYDSSAFHFGQLVEEAVEAIQQVSPRHKVIVQENVDLVFTGDKLRLEQVLNNLLSNAIKYSPDADKIVIRSVVQHANIIVSVQDYGIGIEKGDLSKLFNRYYRTDNTAMRYEGLGLGLYICSEIIKRHNGNFWIESEPGDGSTFYFLLPLNGMQELKEIATDDHTFYKSNYIEIYYDAANHWLEANWLGYQNLESVKKGCMILMDMMKKNGCRKVLNDNTYVLGNWSEASDWGATYWFPAMQKAGLQYFAWIYSASTFSRMAAHKSVDIMLGSITAQFFTEKEAAVQWLEMV